MADDAGAATTLISVPMAGFYMSRRFGASLIAAYCVLLTVNVRPCQVPDGPADASARQILVEIRYG